MSEEKDVEHISDRRRRGSFALTGTEADFVDSLSTLERTLGAASFFVYVGAYLITALEKDVESMYPFYPLAFLLIIIFWIVSLGTGHWQLAVLNLIGFSFLPFSW